MIKIVIYFILYCRIRNEKSNISILLNLILIKINLFSWFLHRHRLNSYLLLVVKDAYKFLKGNKNGKMTCRNFRDMAKGMTNKIKYKSLGIMTFFQYLNLHFLIQKIRKIKLYSFFYGINYVLVFSKLSIHLERT